MKKNNVFMHSCKNTKCIPLNKCNCPNQSTCLIVPVSIHNVCENSHLLVIVEVYKNKKFYTRQIKKIFTGTNKKDNSNNTLIDSIFVDNFKFYFINNCNPKCIHVEINTQYIYNC